MQTCFEDLSANRLFGRVRNSARPEMPKGTWRLQGTLQLFPRGLRHCHLGLEIRLRGLGLKALEGFKELFM